MATRSNRTSRSQRARRGRARPLDSLRARRRDAQAQLLQGVQQVWLAGMGAIAKAQKEGPSAFTDAVAEGLRLLGESRSNAQQMVRDAFETAQETLQTRVDGVRDQAQETWDNLETLFQSRVQRAMHDLGVPTAAEIRELTRRVTDLNDSVQKINARERARGTRPAAGTRRRTSGAKKTPARAARKPRAAVGRRPRKAAPPSTE
jgi:poly(hydroxyalkanoate) granule-associated protein